MTSREKQALAEKISKKKGSLSKFELLQLYKLLGETRLSFSYWENEIKFFKRDKDFRYYFDEIDKLLEKDAEWLHSDRGVNKDISTLVFDVINRRKGEETNKVVA